MSKDVSIVFKASDNLTNSVKQMRKSVDGLSRDVTEYRKVQDQVFSKKAEVKFDMTKAKKELKDLEKAVKENVEGSEKAFKEKQKQIEALNEEYRRLGQVAKEASKAERQLSEDISRSSNKNASRSSIQSDISSGNALSGLVSAGLGNMLSGAISNTLNQQITATYGSAMGSTISSMAGGVLSGAAMGSIAGPIGAAVGAAVGGLTSAINVLNEKQASKDETFKAEVQDIYNLTKSAQEDSLNTGIGLAAQREKDMISYSTILGGGDNANRFLDDVQKFSAKTPFEMNDLLNTSKVMLSYGYKQDEIIPLMTKIGDTGSALGIDADNQKVVATALGRMKSSGKTSLEYINQLSERAIPAIDYLAEALGKTNQDIYEMISKGSIDGAKASQIIADAMGKQFEGNMAKQSATYDGLLSSLSDSWAQIDQSMGYGYTEKRKEGMEKELAMLEATGDKMKEAYSLIGEYQAEMENQHQQGIIDAIAAIQETDEYRKVQEEGNGAEMGRLIAEARAKAEIEYRNSEAVMLQKEADLGLVEAIQQDAAINDAYMAYGRKMGDAFSKGYAGAIESIIQQGVLAQGQLDGLINEKGSLLQKFKNSVGKKTYSDRTMDSFNNRFATGIDRIPYNDMPALLHEGERVLTKVEADKMDKASNLFPTINITVNNNSSSTYEITQEICNQIMKASEVYAGRM